MRDLLRFNREAPALIGLNGSGPTLLDLLDEGGYSREFFERLIVPQASAVRSTDPRDLRTFPASLLAEFFYNHGMFGFSGRADWRAVAGGSSRSVERLTRRCATGCGCPPRWRDLPHESPPVARRGAGLLHDAEPQGGDRPGARDRRARVLPPRVHPGGPVGAEAVGRGKRGAATHYRGAYWG